MDDNVKHGGAIGGMAVGGVIGAVLADGPGALLGMFVGGIGAHYSLNRDSRKHAGAEFNAGDVVQGVQGVFGCWLGTITGGALGLLVAGPVGAVVGGVIGYVGRDSALLSAPPAPPPPPPL